MIDKLIDEQLIKYIMNKFAIGNVQEIPEYFKKQSKEELERKLKEIANVKGTNVTQVARITRVGRRTIEKAWGT